MGDADGNVVVEVTATLDGGTRDEAVTVTLSVGTASTAKRGTGSGDDYTADAKLGDTGDNSVDITIPAGEIDGEFTFKFNPENDTFDEGDGSAEHPYETVVITGSASAATTPATTIGVTDAVLEIEDDDTASTAISLVVDTDAVADDNQSSIGEGDSETAVKVTARLSGSGTYETDQAVAVQVVASPSGGATPSADASSGDYRLKNFADSAVGNVTLPISLGSITIPAGSLEQSATFKVIPRDDEDPEGGESIRVDGLLAGFTVAHADIDFVDNDLPVIALRLGVSSASEDADSTDAMVSATRSASASSDRLVVTVSPQASSSAARGADYTSPAAWSWCSMRAPPPVRRRRSRSTRSRTSWWRATRRWCWAHRWQATGWRRPRSPSPMMMMCLIGWC